MSSASKYKKVIDLIREEKVTLFLGSGCSLGTGAPSANEIVNALIKAAGEDFEEELNGNRSLENVAQSFIEKNGNSRYELISILSKLFSFDAVPNGFHELLPKIPHIRNIFTTNYDTLIEDAYPKNERIVIKSDKGLPYDDKNIIIYKPHGDLSDLSDPDSVLITHQDYLDFFTRQRNPLLWERVKDAFVRSHVVFIGYSLADDNVSELVKSVNAALGQNQKPMFLIAPDFSQTKEKRLWELNVNYINGTGQEFLNEVLECLKLNIVDDIRTKKVSVETGSKFLEINGSLSSTMNVGKDRVEIDSFTTIGDAPQENNVHVKSKLDIQKAIENGEWNESIRVDGTNLTIPALSIPAQDFEDFSWTLNGITVSKKEDISNLWVAPNIIKGKTWVKVPGCSKERAKFIRYKDGEQDVIKIDTPIAVIEIKGDEANGWCLNPEFTASYPDNSSASKWIHLLIELFVKREVDFKSLLPTALHCEDPSPQKTIEILRRIEDFYSTIELIEQEQDIDFEKYDNFSDANERKAKLAFALYHDKAVVTPLSENAVISFEQKDEPIFLRRALEAGESFTMVVTKEIHQIELNGHSFQMPYICDVFEEVLVKGIDETPEGNYKVSVKVLGESYSSYPCNSPISPHGITFYEVKIPKSIKQAV